MNPLQALGALLGNSARTIGNDARNISNGTRMALGAGHSAIMNVGFSGPQGTSEGATPPMMVDGPNGLVPYSSTIGNNKPYAGPTRPAPRTAVPFALASEPLYMKQPLLTGLPTSRVNVGQNNFNPQMSGPQGSVANSSQGPSFNPGAIPMQSSNVPPVQWQAFNSPQQPFMQ